jgi:L-rhamnose isomerase
VISSKQNDSIAAALSEFQIELPSWGLANNVTRFGCI